MKGLIPPSEFLTFFSSNVSVDIHTEKRNEENRYFQGSFEVGRHIHPICIAETRQSRV